MTKTWSFASSAESFAATTGGQSTAAWDSGTGNPAGALYSEISGRNKSNTNYWEWTGTFEAMGVPAGATVTAIQLTGGSTRCTVYNTGASSTAGPWELLDAGGVLLATLYTGRTFTATDSAWIAASGPSRSLASLASSTTVRMRLSNSLATGASNSAAVRLYDDQVTVLITYAVANQSPTTTVTAPANGASIGGPSGTTVTGTANDTDGTVTAVAVLIQRQDDNRYWNGSGWTATETWNAASGTTSWSYAWSWTTDMDAVSVAVTARATDNQGATGTATNTVTVDSKAPVSTVAVRLSPDATPLSGEQLVLKSDWTEASPGANVPQFNWTLNGAAAGWSNADSYTGGVATRNTGVTLNGDDQIILIQSRFTDSFGNASTISESASTVWVQPLTPPAPTVAYISGSTSTLSVTVNANGAETGAVTYAIQCYDSGGSSIGYVQANPGGCSASPVWRTAAAWGTPVVVNGLSAATTYQFAVAAGNPNDGTPTVGANSASPYGTTASAKTGQAVTTGTPTATPAGCQITVSAPFTGDGNGNSTTTILGKQASNCGSPSGYVSIGCDNLTGASPRTCVQSGLTATTDYCYQVTLSDVDGVSGSNPQTVGATTGTCGNTAPTVTITAPAPGSSFTQGTSVTFTGTATDTEDGDLTASLAWASSIDGAIGSGGSFSRSDLSVGTHTITASVTDSGSLTGQDQITVTITSVANTAPTVTITAPTNGSSFTQGTSVTFTGTASDAEDGDLTASISWTSSIDGAIGSGGSISRSNLSVGTHAITASVTDSGSLTGQDQITVTITSAVNNAPTVSISAPTSGTTFAQGAAISFAGTAVDQEDGDLTASLSWTSSIDGTIGSGGSFSRSDLSVGTHTITASVTDSGGASGQDQVTITVSASATTTAAPTATASSCSQITVSAFFTGDADGDGSTKVEWRVTGPNAWTTSCATVTGASPRRCLVVGLTASQSYDIQVTFTDPDTVSGTNPRTVASIAVPACNGSDDAPPTVLVLAPEKNSVVSGADTVRVQVYDSGAGDHSTGITFTRSVDGAALSSAGVTKSANYDCGTDCRVYEFDLDTVGLGLANGSHYLSVEVTDASTNKARVDWPFRVNNRGGAAAGGGYLLRRTHGSQLCIDCHNLPTHSSQSTDSSYGNWAMSCLDCHTPHDTTNIYLVREQIDTPSSGRRPVRFERNTVGATANSSTAGQASFVNEDNATQADGPCQVCHTRTGGATARWRNAAAGGNVASHYTSSNGQACTDCHTHDAGFKGAGGDCIGCHGDAGAIGTTGPNNRRPVNPDFGRQSHHVGNGGSMGGTLTASDCVVCHAEGTIGADGPTTTSWHNDGLGAGGAHRIDLKSADNTSTVYSYDKKAVATSAGAAANWHSGNATWRTQTSTALDPFCLTCHDSNGATASFNAADGGAAQNPFGDGAITNNYDTMTRPAVVDIKSKVSGSPPAQGSFARHAIRGQSTSKYTNYLTSSAWPSNPNGYSTIYSASRFTSMGNDEGGKPNWNDTSVMGCADCHTTDGANGTSGNAHGSDSEYLLKDASGLATEGTYGGPSYNCFRCHPASAYDQGHTGGSSSDFVESVTLTGAARITSADKSYGTRFGMACLNCHGGARGNGTGTGDTNGFGWIHGTSQVFDTGVGGGGAAKRNAYRFMNGGGLRYYLPGNNTTWDTGAGSCYTLNSADSWSGCQQHGNKSQSAGPTLKRPLSY